MQTRILLVSILIQSNFLALAQDSDWYLSYQKHFVLEWKFETDFRYPCQFLTQSELSQINFQDSATIIDTILIVDGLLELKKGTAYLKAGYGGRETGKEYKVSNNIYDPIIAGNNLFRKALRFELRDHSPDKFVIYYNEAYSHYYQKLDPNSPEKAFDNKEALNYFAIKIKPSIFYRRKYFNHNNLWRIGRYPVKEGIILYERHRNLNSLSRKYGGPWAKDNYWIEPFTRISNFNLFSYSGEVYVFNSEKEGNLYFDKYPTVISKMTTPKDIKAPIRFELIKPK